MRTSRNFWTWFVYVLGILLFLAGITLNLWGAYVKNNFSYLDFHQIFLDSYGNIGTGLIDTAITILVIDTLYQKREEYSQRETLFRQLRSNDNVSVLQALEDLKSKGWLKKKFFKNHSFYGANFTNAQLLAGLDLSKLKFAGANLTNANLINTNFSNAILNDTIFVDADLISTNLRGASLVRANFENAILQGVDLQSAILNGAHLYRAKLDGVIFDGETILPDGSRWKPESDLSVFTDHLPQ